VREKPILFSTPMVQAIQDERKSMTRRVIKIDDTPENWNESIAGTSIVRTSPYDVRLSRYKPGDILWVRESSWISECGKYLAQGEPTSRADIVSLETGKRWIWADTSGEYATTDAMVTSWSWEGRYKRGGNRTNDFSVTFADVDTTVKIELFSGNIINQRYEALFRKKLPSIFMPRKAARIFLRVTNVRVERVQDITSKECHKEGIIPCINHERDHCCCAVLEFKKLWNSLNAKRGYGWDSNPWVWVIEFKRVDHD